MEDIIDQKYTLTRKKNLSSLHVLNVTPTVCTLHVHLLEKLCTEDCQLVIYAESLSQTRLSSESSVVKTAAFLLFFLLFCFGIEKRKREREPKKNPHT